MNILWLIGSISETKMNHAVSQILEQRGWTFTFVSSHLTPVQYLESAGLKNVFHAEDLMEHYHCKKQPVDRTELIEMDQKFSSPGLHAIVKGDPYLRIPHYDEAVQRVFRYFVLWERFFDDKSFDFVLHLPTGTSSERCAGIVARNRNIQRGILSTGPCLGRFTVLDAGDEWIWSGFLNAISHRPPSIEEGRRGHVQQFIDEVCEILSVKKPRSFPSFNSFINLQLRYLSEIRGPRNQTFFNLKFERRNIPPREFYCFISLP